jgi:high-affinity K+ transport system ATPase subunit B
VGDDVLAHTGVYLPKTERQPMNPYMFILVMAMWLTFFMGSILAYLGKKNGEWVFVLALIGIFAVIFTIMGAATYHP